MYTTATCNYLPIVEATHWQNESTNLNTPLWQLSVLLVAHLLATVYKLITTLIYTFMFWSPCHLKLWVVFRAKQWTSEVTFKSFAWCVKHMKCEGCVSQPVSVWTGNTACSFDQSFCFDYILLQFAVSRMISFVRVCQILQTRVANIHMNIYKPPVC